MSYNFNNWYLGYLKSELCGRVIQPPRGHELRLRTAALRRGIWFYLEGADLELQVWFSSRVLVNVPSFIPWHKQDRWRKGVIFFSTKLKPGLWFTQKKKNKERNCWGPFLALTVFRIISQDVPSYSIKYSASSCTWPPEKTWKVSIKLQEICNWYSTSPPWDTFGKRRFFVYCI